MSTGALRVVAVLAVLVAAGAVVAAVVASGRAPSLNRALSGVASAVSSAVALPDDGGQDEAAASDGGGGAGAEGAKADAGTRRKKQTAPLSSAQLGAPLVDGHYLAACGAPETMKVTVKVAVKLGKATTVDVDTDPPDTKVSRCVQEFVEGQRWDVSPRTGKFTIRY